MKTDDLINVLAADAPSREGGVGPRLAVAVVAGVVAAAAGLLLAMGVRPDVWEALTTWRFVTKLAIALLAGAVGWTIASRLSSPLQRGQAFWLLSVVALAFVIALGVELAQMPVASWMPRLVGRNALVCLTAIPLLALVPLAAGLYAMRAGAPSSPSLAGASAGLLAGALAAAAYGLHCTDDSPLFVATWYTLAILVVSLLGAAAGRFVLRW